MDVEHFNLLSWFSRTGESHKQDGERLSHAKTRSRRHPAILPWLPNLSSVRPGAPPGKFGRQPQGCRTRKWRTPRRPPGYARGQRPRETKSTTNSKTLDQGLVARLIGALDVVEQLTALG